MTEATGRHLEDFELGEILMTSRRTITETDLVVYTGLSGDFNPLHTDEVFAQDTEFGTRIAQGALGLSVALGLVSQTGLLNGTAVGFLSIDHWRFLGPIRPGDTIQVRAKVTVVRRTSKGDRGVLVRTLDIVNQDGTVVQQGDIAVLVKCRYPADPGTHPDGSSTPTEGHSASPGGDN